MAVVWGNGSATRFGAVLYVGLDMVVSGGAVQPVVYWSLNNGGSLQVNNATLTVTGGAWHEATVALHGKGGDAKYLWDTTFYVTRQYGYSVSGSVTATLAGYGASSTVTVPYTVPALPYSRAATPSNVTASLNDTKQVVLSWTAHPTTAAPISGFKIAKSVNWGSWQYTELGNTRSWTDTSTPEDSELTYAVAAIGAGGNSGLSPYVKIYTKPAMPTGFNAIREGTDALLTWTNAAKYAKQVEIWDGQILLATVQDTTSWRHKNPDPSKTHAYKIRAVINGLTSAYTPSRQVQLLTAPLAPTLLQPDGRYAPIGEEVRLSWQHNPADATSQSKAQIQYRTSGTGSWFDLTSSIKTRMVYGTTFPNRPKFVQWRVRTWGFDQTKPSPWSNVAVINFVQRPTFRIITPSGGVKNLSTPAFLIEAQDNGFKYHIEVKDVNGQGQGQVLSGYNASKKLTGVFDPLENGKEYIVVFRIETSVLSRPQQVRFRVEYAAPLKPIVTHYWNKTDGALVFNIRSETTSDTVPAKTYTLYRVNPFDGERIKIGKTNADPKNFVQIIDKLAPLNGGTYIVEAASADRTTAVTQITDIGSCPLQAIFVTWGENQAYSLALQHDPAHQQTVEREKVLQKFAGRTLPRIVFTPHTSTTHDISGTLISPTGLEENSQISQAQTVAHNLAISTTPIVVRIPDCEPMQGALQSVRLTQKPWGLWHVSFTLVEADF